MRRKSYWLTLRQYISDPKGHHDAADFLSAAAVIASSSALICALVKWISG